ncbi:hypothetical protein M3J09_007192 [Ascochyta lentis]
MESTAPFGHDRRVYQVESNRKSGTIRFGCSLVDCIAFRYNSSGWRSLDPRGTLDETESSSYGVIVYASSVASTSPSFSILEGLVYFYVQLGFDYA